MSVQCGCGRFLANVTYTVATRGLDPHLADVRGDCSRCGPDVQAHRDGMDDWWWSWDAWSPDIDATADELERRVWEANR